MKDKVLDSLIKKEIARQKYTIDLIPSENIVSKEILNILGSPLTNKYSEGYPYRRYYAGNKIIDDIELLAQNRARKLFHLNKNWHVNVQPYSGSPANIAVYYALLNIGVNQREYRRKSADIMGMSLPFGGHLTHGWKVSASGRLWKAVQYGVGRDGLLDYDEIRRLAKKEKPKIIVAGATAYSRIIDFKKFADICREIKSYFMVDMAHIAGLIAAGVHLSPFAYADIVTTTTHKTLRGPRGAIIFINRKSPIAKRNKIDIASAIDKAVFPGLQGGPHDNQTAAIAACLYEAQLASFKKYGRQVVKNAKTLAKELIKLGFRLVSGGTDNHLLLVDLTNLAVSGREAQDKLEEAGIIVNRNTIPYDTRSPFDPSGIRIGTPSATSRGMKEKQMKKIAELIYRVVIKKEEPGVVKKEMLKLCRQFPLAD